MTLAFFNELHHLDLKNKKKKTKIYVHTYRCIYWYITTRDEFPSYYLDLDILIKK